MKNNTKQQYIVYSDYADEALSPILIGMDELNDWVEHECDVNDNDDIRILNVLPTKLFLYKKWIVK